MSCLPPLLITPTIQSYLWGKKGHASFISKFIYPVEPEKHYAELWYGSHPSAPSLAHPSVALSSTVSNDSSAPIPVTEFLDAPLPFLFKILSIGEPLSLQAHPDKKRAVILHACDPKHYPDANHKPEIAVALSELRLVYGFKSLEKLRDMLSRFPSLKSLVGGSTLDTLNSREALLRHAYQTLISSTPNDREDAVVEIQSKIESSPHRSWDEELFLSLITRYGPADIGLPTFLLMNPIVVPPLHGVFVGPNILHAYISGDLVECMAASDNVVRGGLTPKFTDTKTMAEMLNYSEGEPTIIAPTVPSNSLSRLSQNCLEFETPAKEFSLRMIRNSSGFTTEALESQRTTLIVPIKGDVSIAHGAQTVQVPPGRGLLIPSGDTPSVLKASGDALLFLVVGPE